MCFCGCWGQNKEVLKKVIGLGERKNKEEKYTENKSERWITVSK